jgi:hypothetical protein
MDKIKYYAFGHAIRNNYLLKKMWKQFNKEWSITL